MKRENIKNFFKKVRNFSLFDYLLTKRVNRLEFKKELKKDLIMYQQGILVEADKAKVSALRTISKLADEIKVIEHNIENIKKVIV